MVRIQRRQCPHGRGLAASAFITTNTSAAAAGLTWMLLGWIHRRPSVLGAATGAVVGLVAITPAAGYVPVWAAVPIGAVASVISYYVMIGGHKQPG
jgi:Amt family ammonium transporter